MLFQNSVRANREGSTRDLFALEAGQEIVLLGRPGTFAELPQELFRPDLAMMLLRHSSVMPDLRRCLAGYRLIEELSRLTNRDVLQQVDWAIRTGRLEAIVAISNYSRDYVGPPIRPGQPAPPAPTGGNPLRPDDPSVAGWSNKEKVAESIRRARAWAPAGIAAGLRLLHTADGVDRVVGSVIFEDIAKRTPHAGAIDGTMAGIALAHGGIAGLYVLRDIVDFLKRAAEARTPRDLEGAAEALANAVTVLDAPGFVAVLHKAGIRSTGGGAGVPAEAVPSFRDLAAAQAERLKARQQRAGGRGKGPPPPAKPVNKPSKGPYKTAKEAAKAALTEANPKSIKDNLEYGGLIYKDAKGDYYYSGPIQGSDQGVDPADAPAPAGSTVVADYHTHGDYSLEDPKTGAAIRTSDPKRDDFNSDNFSTTDKASAKELGYDAYLGTPSGTFRHYDQATGADTTF